MRTWLIAGISRGLGKALAEAALARGDTVIGTMRQGSSDIAAGNGALHVLSLDVADSGAVEATVAQSFRLAWRIDVLVNNAGCSARSRTPAMRRSRACSTSTSSAPCG
jgi:NAD(P)-dependent dehydrogenase (short-subunit alcohol dehydrogenase family)